MAALASCNVCSCVNTVCDLPKYNQSNPSHPRRHACERCRQTSTTEEGSCKRNVTGSENSVITTQLGRSKPAQQRWANPALPLYLLRLIPLNHAEKGCFRLDICVRRVEQITRTRGNAAIAGGAIDLSMSLHKNARKSLILNAAQNTQKTVGCVGA